ncbi:porin family protein [bacterium endosymbiont of Bathymodiolus sp. 5 South]|jgi:hypothetical protein|uniref:porin family protein n=1 Tax=bacterium endosymbiont of Bathymodiolus sp. 5 South TaxID=1181670 RepID=UPI0010B6E631|nr:porin family protein [bacterium endosymbiont of Bathymodiolus sp. 5 South]CAC9635811.1 hypothetical protein [uncultured Gammaproteobacteria bacterium]CAC9641582.1 hypothetical protein [uncultured Gammaproteobacteria bacterium]SHN90663.1 hypothetical protein BCLUESOX_797 [bacterium endosymbiont of Bathymodiolus sp. 5 South]VVH54761.1 hypothetical protein BSPCLSOX_1794 [uncultured Gammaproteobacteria bacterium]
MKTQLKVIALSVLVATSVHAKESKGIYFGLGMAQSKISTSYDETSEYKKNNWKALIGMRLNSNWSIEGQYTNFAKDLFMNTSIAADGTKTTKEDALSGKSFGVTGLYHFNPQGSYSPFVKLGWHHWSFKNKENVSASGNHEFYGVGLDGKINETIKYRVEFERMNLGNTDMDNIGASLLFGF